MLLNHLGLIEVRGADAEAFLQGQLSNDLKQLSATRAQLSSYNSPKGRMLAVLHLFRSTDAFFLEIHRSVLGATLKRLRTFVLRSKVTLEDASARLAILGVAGPQAAARLQALRTPAPAAAMDLAWAGDIAVIRRHGDTPRFSAVMPAEAGIQFSASLQAQKLDSRLAGNDPKEAAWKLLDIEAGIPTVYAETSDHFVPQMCNLDALGGISFNKGCYTGQEVVARVHYRGAVKRRMTQLLLPDSCPAPGEKIPQGEVVDAVGLAEGGSLALVVGA